MESDDKKLYTPKYVQIEDHIISEIRNGRLKTGDRIPSEAELVRMFGVSRITVTTAIKELTARGILVRRQGKGTFVRRDDPEISEETDGFSDAQAGSAASASRTIAFGGGIRLASPEKAEQKPHTLLENRIISADPHDTLLPRICFIEQKIAENGILGAVGPLVVHIGEISGFQIIDCVTVPLRVRISLTISPEWKFIEHFVGFLSRVLIIIMADRQEITPVGKKMDPCDDGRNGRAAHGLAAGRGDLVKMSDPVLLIPFFSIGAGCGKEQGIIRCPCPCFRVTAGCDPGNRFSFQIIQIQVRQISV